MKNYKNEIIPSIKSIKKLLDVPLSFEKKHKFNDLFSLDSEGRNRINKEYITANFKLNSKLNKKVKYSNEIKGLYIIFDEHDKPIYLGISQTIFRRLKQHFTGKNHNESTLVYIISLMEYQKENNSEYKGLRKNFSYKSYRDKIQNNLRNKNTVVIIPENNNYILYFKEIYYSCYYKTFWNTFETH